MRYVVLALLVLSTVLQAQELKHLTAAPENGSRPSELSALSIDRGAEYPAVIHLKGSVEIRTPVCLPVGENGRVVCDGEMILRADEALFHEDSGKIEASGSVSVTPLQHRPKP